MTDALVTDAVMRQFLLGQLKEIDRQRVEEVFVCDAEIRERVLMAEEDLIEDYLEGSLTVEDRQRFRVYYLSSPQQYRKLRIAEALRQTVIAELSEEKAAVGAVPDGTSKRQSFLKLLGFKNGLPLVPLAITLTVVVVAGSIWLIRLQRLHSQEQNRQLTIQRELEQINTPEAIKGTPASEVFSAVVTPISVRAVTQSVEPPPRARILELWLVNTEGQRYPRYQVQLSRIGSREAFSLSNLHTESRPDGNAVRLRIPISLLSPGAYQILLSGVDANGQAEVVGEYTLQFGG